MITAIKSSSIHTSSFIDQNNRSLHRVNHLGTNSVGTTVEEIEETWNDTICEAFTPQATRLRTRNVFKNAASGKSIDIKTAESKWHSSWLHCVAHCAWVVT